MLEFFVGVAVGALLGFLLLACIVGSAVKLWR